MLRVGDALRSGVFFFVSQLDVADGIERYAGMKALYEQVTLGAVADRA
mgnify:CR=1 FL=1